MSASSPSGPPGAEPSAIPPAPSAPPPAPPPGASAHGAAAHAKEAPHLHPEHFMLSPEVARLPLAHRRQRLGAILVDLLLVVVLTKAFSSLGLLAGAFAGTLLYWAAGRPFAPAWMHQKTARIGLALALCIGFIAAGRLLPQGHGKAEDDAVAAADGRPAKRGPQVHFDQLGLEPRDVLTMATTQDPAEARRLAERLRAGLEGQPDPQAASAELLGLVERSDVPMSQVSRAELLRVLSPLAMVQAPPEGDADPRAQELAALKRSNAQLSAQVERLDEEADRLEDELEEAREDRGVLHFLKASVKDLGFGIGWSYVYFIGFLVLWKGHTPGKRLFGIRVLRIDGRPMTLWRSWERFHGYAASMLTGLLGFLQILWDPSRQCLHDKVAETVVVQDRHHPHA